MSLNLKNKGKCIAIWRGKSDKKMIYLDANDSSGLKNIQFQSGSGSFEQVPNTETRDSLLLSGPTGSGKSYYAAKYIKLYEKLFPGNKIYLISKVEDDPAFSDIKDMKRIDPNLFLECSNDSSQFSNCLIIFDDIDQLRPDQVRKEVTSLRDQILETGRHQNIYIISTSHLLTNFKQSRILLNEANSITIYPGSGNFYIYKRWLKEYIGLSKNNIEEIKNTKSRWVTIFKNYPITVMMEDKIYIPKN